MEKQLKDSVKTEMKAMVQKELVKIMAKKIAKEKLFEIMAQEFINNFYEETPKIVDESMENKTCKKNDLVNRMDNVKEGKFKNFFEIMINKPIPSPNIGELKIPNLKNPTTNLNDILKEDFVTDACGVIEKMELDGSCIEKQNRIKIYSHILDGDNSSEILAKLEPKENEYHLIEYTDDTLNKLLHLLDVYKLQLKISSEIVERYPSKIMGYKVSNGINKFSEDGETINEEHLSFNIERAGLSIIELKNLSIGGSFIGQGVISMKTATEILDIIDKCEISNTTDGAEIIKKSPAKRTKKEKTSRKK